MKNKYFWNSYPYPGLLAGYTGIEYYYRSVPLQSTREKMSLISKLYEKIWGLIKLITTPPEDVAKSNNQNQKNGTENIRIIANEPFTKLQSRGILPEINRESERILVVEGISNYFCRKVVIPLHEAGFFVILLPFSSDIKREIDEISPSVIILDEALHGENSIEICARLRQIFNIPIILLGSDSGCEQWARAVKAGVDFYLRIPFGDRVLVARVNAILRRYKANCSPGGNRG